jgi:hypothetical protein
MFIKMKRRFVYLSAIITIVSFGLYSCSKVVTSDGAKKSESEPSISNGLTQSGGNMPANSMLFTGYGALGVLHNSGLDVALQDLKAEYGEHYSFGLTANTAAALKPKLWASALDYTTVALGASGIDYGYLPLADPHVGESIATFVARTCQQAPTDFCNSIAALEALLDNDLQNQNLAAYESLYANKVGDIQNDYYKAIFKGAVSLSYNSFSYWRSANQGGK